MRHQTILIHRGGYGSMHRLGEIEVRPEGADFHGHERSYVRLSVLGDGRRSECSCVGDSLESVLRDFTATAALKETHAEAAARRRRESERQAARARRKWSSRRYSRY